MALKKPSDFFREDNKSGDTIHELVKRPELQSFSEAFDVYKNNLSKLDNLADTINCVEDIKSEIQDFIKKEDLDNSMMAYTFLLEESINKLKRIDRKKFVTINSSIASLATKIDNFITEDLPKYKDSIIEDFGISKEYKNEVTKKVSELEFEISRNESWVKNHNKNIESIQGEFIKAVERLDLNEIRKQSNKLDKKLEHVEEVFKKFNEKTVLNEGLLNIPPNVDNSDPLTPLDQNFVTLDQLQEHYKLFINRIQRQLATLGGGGETRLQYLDDISGIATNLSAYNNYVLKVDTSQSGPYKFKFATDAAGLWQEDSVGITTIAKVGIGTTAKESYSLYVEGDTRITGILTVGTASITLDPTAKKLSGLDEVKIGSGSSAITMKKSPTTGNIEFADESGNESAVGVGTTIDINTSGIITAHSITAESLLGDRIDVSGNAGIGSLNVTGVSTFTGIVTTVGDLYVGGDLYLNDDLVLDNITGNSLKITGLSTFSGNIHALSNVGIGTTNPQADLQVGTGVTVYGNSGIVSATKFYGDGAGLENTGASLDEVSGIERLVLSDLTTGTMVSAATTSDLTFNSTNDTLHVGSGVTMYASTGIVSATKFYGDGAGLENTGASLDEVSGIERLVLSDLTTGTMVSAATTSDLTFNSTNDTLHVGSGVTMYASTGIVSATSFYGSLVGNADSATTATNASGLNGNPDINVSNIVGTALSISGIATVTDTLKVGTAITASAGIITATKFVKTSGTSTQFLKADGSVDTSTYLTAESDTLDSVLGRGNSSSKAINVGISTLGNVSSGFVKLYNNSNLVFETVGTGVSIANAGLNTATIFGPSNLIIDPHPVGVATTSGIVRIKGDLYVDGTEFIVNSETITLGDFVVGIATTVTTNLLTDGAGIGIGSIGHEKTFKYEYNSGTAPSLKSSENLNVASGKGYQIAETEVLNATTLGSAVVNSSLTSIGTLGSLDVTANAGIGSLNVTGVSTFSGNIHAVSNVGIGTDNPSNPLHVVGSANITGIITATTFSGALSGTATTATNVAITDDTSGSGTHYLHFGSATSGNDGIEVDSTGLIYKDGNLGIGTNNPSALMHLYGSSPKLYFTDTDTNIESQIDNDSGGGNFAINVDVNNVAGSDANFMVRFNQTAPVSAAKFLINQTGNVGIGTHNPDQKLHVYNGAGDVTSFVEAIAGDALLNLSNSGNGNYSGINFTRERGNNETGRVGGSIWMPSNTSNNEAFLYIQAQSANAGAGVTGALSDNNGVRLKLHGDDGIFSIENGSNETFRVGAGGSVGIGTDNPLNPLHITGADPQIKIQDSANGNNAQIFLDGPNSNLNFDWVSGANRKINFINSGSGGISVGIGTDNPTTLLQVGDVESGRLNFDGSNTLSITGPEGGAARIDLISDQGDDDADKWRITSTSGNDLKFQRSTSHTDTLVIKQSGDVGINTITPQAELDVRGNAIFGLEYISGAGSGLNAPGITTIRGHHVNSEGDFARLYFANSKSATGSTGFTTEATASIRGVRVGDNWKTELAFYTNNAAVSASNPHGEGSERLRITSAGDVGIGSVNPSVKLDVAGTVKATAFDGPLAGKFTGLLREDIKITAGKLSDNVNINLSDGMMHLFTTQESTTSTPNVRVDGSTTLTSQLGVGEATTVLIYSKAAAAGFSTNLSIDSTTDAITVDWLCGSNPVSGGTSGYDLYTYNIIKTGENGSGIGTYTVFANLVNYTSS